MSNRIEVRDIMDQVGTQAPTKRQELPEWAHDFMEAHQQEVNNLRERIYELEKQFEPFKRAFETMFQNEVAMRVGSAPKGYANTACEVTGLDKFRLKHQR